MFDQEEIMRTISPSKNIQCKDCVHRLRPIEFMGKKRERYTYGTCNAFERKPPGVLWKGESCELYKKEEKKKGGP